ncbi:MAG: hypothetical protein NC489_37915 [Ruminococcus flavefaciens]|nr:hypothetical protein [Ruminococcus flavefaciens]
MDGQPEKRMAENYEITQSVYIGDKEVVIGLDETNAMPYFCAFYTSNEICGSYSGCMISDDYVEIMELFAGRVKEQCEKVRSEQEKITVPREPITEDMCLSLASDTSLVGKVAAIRMDALRPEYRSAPDQLVYVTGGHGALRKGRGSACFCKNLYSGMASRWERQDIQGEIKPECLPDWARERAEKIQKKEKDRRER